MDETTLKDPAVKAALDGYTRIKFQAEDPEESPAKDLMQRIGAVGLPAYVIVRAKAEPLIHWREQLPWSRSPVARQLPPRPRRQKQST